MEMTDVVRNALSGLRNPDRLRAVRLIEGAELNHVERKILAWSVLDRMSMSDVSERLCLSQTRVKHLKRGALEKVNQYMMEEWDAKVRGQAEAVQL